MTAADLLQPVAVGGHHILVRVEDVAVHVELDDTLQAGDHAPLGAQLDELGRTVPRNGLTAFLQVSGNSFTSAHDPLLCGTHAPRRKHTRHYRSRHGLAATASRRP